MSYQTTLPRVFPYCYALSPDDVRGYVTVLISKHRTDVPQGSSFAVTVDNWDGTWNLWLSSVSRKFLGLPDLQSNAKE